ncbi:MAG: hypothetical protein OXF66_08420 [Gammaproteobacteria bacterium]|nr:hypothetical protein [Gammaproteobacteria bacterium]
MKRLRPGATGGPPEADSQARRRSAFRFGFSAVVASFVVLGLLILGAMFQEEYEEGFVRLVSYAVRLASPEEIAEAEAQGPIPAPLPAIRPDTPVAVIAGPIVEENEMRGGQIALPAPETLVPIEDFLIETPNGIELTLPDNPTRPSAAPAAAPVETE